MSVCLSVSLSVCRGVIMVFRVAKDTPQSTTHVLGVYGRKSVKKKQQRFSQALSPKPS